MIPRKKLSRNLFAMVFIYLIYNSINNNFPKLKINKLTKIESAVKPLCDRLSDLGIPYRLVRAVRCGEYVILKISKLCEVF